MNKFLRDIALILFLALLWLVSGAMLAVGIRNSFGVEWVAPCSSLSVLLGMVLLLTKMRDEQERRRLFGEADEDMPFSLGLAALIVIPVLFMIIGLIWSLKAWFSF